ncbi:hypothetical protein CBR_g45784 [Chara braunii]|uniref:Uncharacterized protein n=1 Tax=Chara braunii TaxID=69332 RepID=A0A388LZD7_CHABU|nr:hypothetical protein CBR_g45784 [Chara braunii]|eukprot:GBG87631.1 hypothetical protein CBR_g45784 [Chara braunii]
MASRTPAPKQSGTQQEGSQTHGGSKVPVSTATGAAGGRSQQNGSGEHVIGSGQKEEETQRNSEHLSLRGTRFPTKQRRTQQEGLAEEKSSRSFDFSDGESSASSILPAAETMWNLNQEQGKEPDLGNRTVFSQLWYTGTIRPLSKKAAQSIRVAAAGYMWKPGAEEGQGHMPKLAWDKITATKEEGGLAVLDPTRQIKALLAKWPVKATMDTEDQSWVALAEYILAKEWDPSNGEDVWRLMLTQAYQRRKLKSVFWQGVIQAWRTVAPALVREPGTRDEVLRQPLFENGRIKDQRGLVFAIAGRGNYGRAWVERGVIRIGDLWDEGRKIWKTAEELRDNLGRLWHVEERREALIQAIPVEWKQRLENETTTGKWYRPVLTMGEDHQFFKQVDNGKFEVWERNRAEGIPQCTMVFKEERVIGNPGLMEEVRVFVHFSAGGPPQPVLHLDGTPIRSMRLDIRLYGWSKVRGQPFISQYTPKLGMGIQRLEGSNSCKIQETIPESLTGSNLSVEY